jgi:hypothetical protein
MQVSNYWLQVANSRAGCTSMNECYGFVLFCGFTRISKRFVQETIAVHLMRDKTINNEARRVKAEGNVPVVNSPGKAL